MDVTYTNGLEGLGQYFQALPIPPDSSADPAYPTGEQHTLVANQNNDRIPQAVPHWPSQQESQIRRPPTRERTTPVEHAQRPPSQHTDLQRPPSNHSDSQRLPPHHGELQTPASHHSEIQRPVSHHAEMQRSAAHHTDLQRSLSYHGEIQRPPVQNMQQGQARTQSCHTSYTESSNGQQFQFSRPSSLEAPSNVSQHYSSHILPNPTYHQPHSPQQLRPRQEQLPNPTPSYHQLQPAQSITQQHQSQPYPNYTQPRTYYHAEPQQTKTPTSTNNYKTVSSQAYSLTGDNAYKNAYPAYSMANHYLPQKQPALSTSSESKVASNVVTSQSAPNSQAHRTTHNLPPIAALSSVNYHSSRTNREALRLGNQRQRQAVAPISSSNTTQNQTNHITPSHIRTQDQYLHENHQDYRNGPQATVPNKLINQSYHYAATTSTTTYAYPTAASTGVTPTYQTMSIQNQSSSNTNFQLNQKQSQQQERPQQQQANQNQRQNHNSNPQQSMTTSSSSNNNVNLNQAKQKRESPLDLSVKTVRTSADSTLDDAEEQRTAKYYAPTSRPTPVTRPSQHTTAHNYPTYDVYNSNSFQRNLGARSQMQSVGAPKVDFLPNFNMPSLKNSHPQGNTYKADNRKPMAQPPQAGYDKNYAARIAYDKNAYLANTQSSNVHRFPVGANPSNPNTYNKSQLKRPMEGLPRIDFPPPELGHKTAVYPSNSQDLKKRAADSAPSVIPSKVPKVDNWRQTIDQQIDQRISSYTKSKLQQEQKQQLINKPLVNGNFPQTNQERPKETYPNTYHRPQYQLHQTFANTSQYSHPQSNHNQTYVPSAVAHQFPGYSSSYSSQLACHPQHHLHRANSTPSLPVAGTNRSNIGGAADKRVLSLLRNSLEIKGAKEAQRKLEQDQINKNYELKNARPDVQQPSTDVTAPLQPKPGIIGRHNVSPFTAASLLERNSNTPPTYKFPKAMDSVKVDEESNRNSFVPSEKSDGVPNANDWEYIALRIRTKAELKELGSTQNMSNNLLGVNFNENQILQPNPKHCAQIPNNPPINFNPSTKLIREKTLHPPRRILLGRTDEDGANSGASVKRACLPPREKSGFRSSSETSVFDFPDSDSECEMSLERKTLEAMRRDRKSNIKPFVTEMEIKQEPQFEQHPFDDSFDDACSKFVEQLKQSGGKKRGRRKKESDFDPLTDFENDVVKNEVNEIADDSEIKIKEEIKEIETSQKEILIKEEIVVQEDSDSDVPLSRCKTKPLKLDGSEMSVDVKIKVDVFEHVDDTSETKTLLFQNTKESPKQGQKEEMQKPQIPINTFPKPGKKPTFGDGTDFYPGWEEALYKYKRALRMPASLIHVTRPPNCQRLSTSLPDLDPCPISPAPSSVADNVEFNMKTKTKIKHEILDSDMDSNSSFNFSFNKTNYDSEGSSSVKSLNIQTKPKETSVADILFVRLGAKKHTKNKKREDPNGPKVIPKSENELELLPTPSLELSRDSKSSEAIIRSESVLLGFRKKTVSNFKNAFIKNSNSVIGINEQFATVVLKSRTRTETRVLKQKATIREVFGEDRPASAPPVTCLDDLKHKEEDLPPRSQLSLLGEKKSGSQTDIQNPKEVLKNKLMSKGKKRDNLFKELASKKIKKELPDDASTIAKDSADTKKRSVRRKFSTGFDYLKKKKKPVKKEGKESENAAKLKRRGLLPKATPESVQDIQREIKTWVLSKGIGETHLHRAARLGYTVSETTF